MSDIMENFIIDNGMVRDHSKFDLITTTAGDLSIKDADIFWDELGRAVETRDMCAVIHALSLFDIWFNLPKDLNR